jgi:uncharacterized membrane protein YphA (DoxX/SURF4 family)
VHVARTPLAPTDAVVTRHLVPRLVAPMHEPQAHAEKTPSGDRGCTPVRATPLSVSWLANLRRTRWANLAIINLRILIGFAFLPAAIKKILDQPFTDPTNRGPFHDFLHAFHATGWFYQAVGVLQLVAAALLISQRFALVGALVALPMLTAITLFCWSTHVVPTATVATLMWLGTIALVVWDVDRWRGVFVANDQPVDLRRWQWCGAIVVGLYVTACVVHGGVYRPRGIRLDDPVFFVLPAIAFCPLVTLVLDALARRRT